MIGLMDWGIGGLSVYKTMPEGEVLYFSDSGYTPYGKTERNELRARLGTIAQFYKRHGVSEVVVACNAASSALDTDEEFFDGDVKFTSIIPSGVRAVSSSEAKSVGVIGGLLTINSGLYQQRLKHIAKNFSFSPAQPLSALVERGALTGDAVENEIRKILANLGDIDALLLACTHYPALNETFRKLAPHIELLDPAKHVWTQTKNSNSETRTRTQTQTRKLSVFTTGPIDQMRTSARAAWNLTLPTIAQVQLP